MIDLGIMQGRLSSAPCGETLDWFPFDDWREEFKKANKIGFNYIELVIDRYSSPSNPLLSTNIKKELLYLADKNNLKLPNCCLNNIIENSIFSNEGFSICLSLIDKLISLNIENIILPLFSASEFNPENLNAFFFKIFDHLNNKKINFLIESDVPIIFQKKFLDELNRDNIGLVYDLGNAAYFGYDIKEDITLVNNYIKLIHIKDKNQYGENVSLGKGIVDFSKLKDLVNLIDSKTRFTLETSRGLNPLQEQQENYNFILDILKIS